MTKVSVIVPAYNTAEYLPRCLDSLVQQSLSDIEIICVNDGSTDGSLAVMQDYAAKDNRIKVIDFKQNKGVSEARNAGIKMATGIYVAFVDSDDTVDLNFYEKLYAKAEATGADIVKGDMKEFVSPGRIRIYEINQNILKYRNKVCFYCSFTTAIYRLSLIKNKHCFFNSRLMHTEDLVWLNRMTILANTVEIVADVYYNYWRREGSADSAILSIRCAQSSYIGWKHIFLNTLHFARDSNMNFSFCFQNYFNCVLSLIFRLSDVGYKWKICKLLFFIYYNNREFYNRYLYSANKAVYPYFQQNLLNEFFKFIKEKKFFVELMVTNLRGNLQQKKSLSKRKISVIIPVYNVEDYLKTCLDSICRQTHENLEIICVDDCSTDNSLRILNDYAAHDNRIRIIHLDKNSGPSLSRQTGIDAATGDYIGFIDSDDWIDDDYYAQMLQIAERDKTDIVVNSNILSHQGEKVFPHSFPGHKSLSRKIYNNPAELVDKLFCVVWNKMYKIEFLKQCNYSINQKLAHTDVYFHYTTFAFAKNVTFFDGPAYHYRYREQSISNSQHDWGIAHIKVYSLVYDFYRQNDLLAKKVKLYSTMPFFNIQTPEMFDIYKSYFSKIADYVNQNQDIFNPADIYIVNAVAQCQDYSEYVSKYPANLMMCYIRRKR